MARTKAMTLSKFILCSLLSPSMDHFVHGVGILLALVFFAIAGCDALKCYSCQGEGCHEVPASGSNYTECAHAYQKCWTMYNYHKKEHYFTRGCFEETPDFSCNTNRFEQCNKYSSGRKFCRLCCGTDYCNNKLLKSSASKHFVAVIAMIINGFLVFSNQ